MAFQGAIVVRKRGRVDANQGEIVAALRNVGAMVKSVANEGDGFADLIVVSPYSHRVHLLEVKARKGRLTAAQLEVHQRWSIQIVRSVDDALKAIGVR